MKCPHCGADTAGTICEYCGSELPDSGPRIQNTYTTENVTHNVTNVYYVNSGRPDTDSVPVDFSRVQPIRTADFPQPVYQAAVPASGSLVSDRNKSIAMLLCFFFGYFGGHLFYVGRWKKGLVYLFTCGLFCIGWLVDLFAIGANKFKDAKGRTVTGNAKIVTLIIIVFFVMAFISAISSGPRY